MRTLLSATVLLASLLALPGCSSPPKPAKPVASAPLLSPEYQAVLDKVLRVPQPHPLLDEGLVPQRALEIVVAYQDIARRGRFRELSRYYAPETQTQSRSGIETPLLRREVEHGPTIEILRDVLSNENATGTYYEFTFTSVNRARSHAKSLVIRKDPAGQISLTSLPE